MVVRRRDHLTDPEDAKRFCDALDLAAFACAVGTAHGYYKGEPKVAFDRIDEINRRTHTPMALARRHGPVRRDLPQGIERGCAKINISTNLKHVFVESFVDYHNGEPQGLRAAAAVDGAVPGVQGAVRGLHRASSAARTAARSCWPKPPERPTASPMKALIFDCDGVLVDTERDGHRVGFNRAFADAGHRRRMGRPALRQAVAGRRRQGAHAAYFDAYGWPAGTRADNADPGAAQDARPKSSRTWSPRAGCRCAPASRASSTRRMPPVSGSACAPPRTRSPSTACSTCSGPSARRGSISSTPATS